MGVQDAPYLFKHSLYDKHLYTCEGVKVVTEKINIWTSIQREDLHSIYRWADDNLLIVWIDPKEKEGWVAVVVPGYQYC